MREDGRRARGSESSSTIVTLAVVLEFFQTDLERADINAICRNNDDYRGVTVNLRPAGGADLDTLFDQDLLWV